MTRKEQREQASVEYQMNKNPMALGGDVFADMIYRLNINPSFIAGAEWADEHPNKLTFSASDRGIIDEIIFALNTLGKEKMISYSKEINFLNNIRKL